MSAARSRRTPVRVSVKRSAALHEPAADVVDAVTLNVIAIDDTLIDSAGAAASGPRTLRRGLRILEALREAGPEGFNVVELARLTGVQRPTVYRFVDVLVDEGYALRNAQTRRVQIAPKWMAQRDAHADAVHKLRPALRRISDVTGDASFLICRSGNESLCLHRETGSYPVQVQAVTIGHRQPLGVGAAGLALLAALPAGEALELINQNAAALRAYGNMNATRMRVLVESTLVRGWAVVGDAAVPGVLGVGVALLDAHRYPIVAVSVSSMISRMPAERQRSIAEVIRQELARIVL